MEEHAFYDITFKRLYRYFFYRGVPKTEIEDLVQEVYLRFFQKHTINLAEDQILKTLYKISGNVGKEWVRQTKKHAALSFDESMDSPLSKEEFLDEEYEEHIEALKEVLKAGIILLSPALRPVIELRFLEGRTRAETAAALSMSESQVHVYQQRGIRALRKWLAEQEAESAVAPTSYT